MPCPHAWGAKNGRLEASTGKNHDHHSIRIGEEKIIAAPGPRLGPLIGEPRLIGNGQVCHIIDPELETEASKVELLFTKIYFQKRLAIAAGNSKDASFIAGLIPFFQHNQIEQLLIPVAGLLVVGGGDFGFEGRLALSSRGGSIDHMSAACFV